MTFDSDMRFTPSLINHWPPTYSRLARDGSCKYRARKHRGMNGPRQTAVITMTTLHARPHKFVGNDSSIERTISDSADRVGLRSLISTRICDDGTSGCRGVAG